MKFDVLTMEDALDALIDYRGKTPKKSDKGIMTLSAKSVKNNHIDYSQCYFISEEEYKRFMVRGFPQKGDILLTTEAPLGMVTRLDRDDIAIAQRLLTLRGKKDVLDNDYLLYYLQSPLGQASLKARETGTTVTGIKQSEFRKIELKLPTYKIQRKISSILRAIDDKIELNNAINNNLEQQAQAIFNKFISERADMPKTSVEDIVLTANTGADAIQKAPIVDYDTGIRCVRVGDMTNNRSFHDWGYTKVTEEVFNRYQLHKNDIIVTRTASLGLNTIISEDLPAVYNNGLIRLSINDKKALPIFVYRQFQTDDFSNYIARIESETSVRPNMKINYLLKYEFKLPSLDEQKELVDLLQPMIEHQNSLINENKALESLRDILLPKLMSGEIDVSNIEF